MIAEIKRIKKGSRKNILSPVLIIITILAVIGFLTFSNLKISQRRAELRSQIESIKKEIQLLEKKNSELRAGITKTESESYWEEKIREQGYKKLGEEQVVVLPPEESKEKETKTEKSFWQKFLDQLGF
jgi:cell division protein FtsB